MRIVDKKISRKELLTMSEKMYENLVKAVIDVEKGIMVVDAGLHADQEALLLSQGSLQKNLYGINLYPARPDEKMIEFDSMINIRPGFGNSSRGVDDKQAQEKIKTIVKALVEK